MRKLVILLLALLLIGCSSKITISFYKSWTSNPSYLIDSINTAENINIRDYTSWEYNYYIGNDSTIIKQYVTTFKKGKVLHIMSLTGKDNDSIYLLNYRKE